MRGVFILSLSFCRAITHVALCLGFLDCSFPVSDKDDGAIASLIHRTICIVDLEDLFDDRR